MKIGFIGLGNVGGKLAGSLVRNKFDVMVRDLDREVAQPFLDMGAEWGPPRKRWPRPVILSSHVCPHLRHVHLSWKPKTASSTG